MSTIRYFNNLYIPPNSPLTHYLQIPSGYYSGEYNFETQELYLISNSEAKTKKGKFCSLRLTGEQLFVILQMVGRDRGDKFTEEHLRIIQQMGRPDEESGVGGTNLYPAPHRLPVDVC